jgi:transcriptional regulator with XRE-family HTH domain
LLRKLRTDRKLTAEEVTEQLLFSPTKLSRIETGQSGATARDIRDLCDLYQVTDPAERENLMTLAREGKQRGWWKTYSLPYGAFVDLETEATSIQIYLSSVIPGQLQTEEYARELMRVGDPKLNPQELEQRVQGRLDRRVRLAKSEGKRQQLDAVLDEAVLRRAVGGPRVMGTQLKRLAESAAQQNITVQVIPFGSGAHAAMESNFCILSFDQPLASDIPPLASDIVYVEGLVGNI